MSESLLSKIDRALSGAPNSDTDPVLAELDPPPRSGRPKPAARFGLTPQVLALVAARVRVPKADAAELRRLDGAWLQQFEELKRFAARTAESLAAEAAEQAGEALVAGKCPTEPILDAAGWAGRRDTLISSRKLAMKSIAASALEVARPHLEAGVKAALGLIQETAREERERAERFGLPFQPSACEALLSLQCAADALRQRAALQPGHGARPATIFAGLLDVIDGRGRE